MGVGQSREGASVPIRVILILPTSGAAGKRRLGWFCPAASQTPGGGGGGSTQTAAVAEN